MRRMSGQQSSASLEAIARLYFDGLNKKDISSVPWSTGARLHAPLNPNGGAANPITGRENIRAFFEPILPNISSVKVLRTFVSGDWVAVRADIAVGPAVLRVVDCLKIENGQIVEQENHYDPRPALGG